MSALLVFANRMVGMAADMTSQTWKDEHTASLHAEVFPASSVAFGQISFLLASCEECWETKVYFSQCAAC